MMWACLRKQLLETLRHWQILSLTLLFAPFFLLLMWLFYGQEPAPYHLGILNNDAGTSGQALIRQVEQEGRDWHFTLHPFADRAALLSAVKAQGVDLGVIIPAEYSRRLHIAGPGAAVEFHGTTSNPRYLPVAALTGDVLQRFSVQVKYGPPPVTVEEHLLETQAPLNEFQATVPGMLALSVLMILLTACAAIVKEGDEGTLLRLKLSRLGVPNHLGSLSIVQAVIAVIALLLAALSALLLGYPISSAQLWALLAVGAVSSLGMVAFSLVIASFLNTVFDVLTVGTFPFFLLMFFSGSMFPLPKLPLFSLAGHPVGPADLLPLTHTVTAFTGILNGGAGQAELWFPLTMLLMLTALYFWLGFTLYDRRKLSAASFE